MARESHSSPKTALAMRLAAVLGLTAAIFIADTVTELQIAVAVFYVAVVLISMSFLRPRGVILVCILCMLLTIISYFLSPSGSRESGLINCAISLSAIAVTTYLALKAMSAALAVHEARAQLAQVARVVILGELTASIAHEVNQPLAAVVASGNACLRWLAAQPPNLAKAQHAVERIIKDANRASDVITRVRSLAKRAPAHEEWLNVPERVSEIIALTRSELETNQIVLRTQIAEDLPPIRADGVQVQQVLLNMILNAIEAMQAVDERARQLEISVDAKGGKEIAFAVRDSGTGVEADTLERLFDPFYSTKPNGMGIGLTISRSIIEAHGGRIWAEANSGGGAIFHFTLPVRVAEVQ